MAAPSLIDQIEGALTVFAGFDTHSHPQTLRSWRYELLTARQACVGIGQTVPAGTAPANSLHTTCHASPCPPTALSLHGCSSCSRESSLRPSAVGSNRPKGL